MKKFTKKQRSTLKNAGLVPEKVPAAIRTEVGSRDEVVMEALSPQGLKARAVDVVEEIERRIRTNYEYRLSEIQQKALPLRDRLNNLEKFDEELGKALRSADAEIKELKGSAERLRGQLVHAMKVAIREFTT